jgi:hypothetical protein
MVRDYTVLRQNMAVDFHPNPCRQAGRQEAMFDFLVLQQHDGGAQISQRSHPLGAQFPPVVVGEGAQTHHSVVALGETDRAIHVIQPILVTSHAGIIPLGGGESRGVLPDVPAESYSGKTSGGYSESGAEDLAGKQDDGAAARPFDALHFSKQRRTPMAKSRGLRLLFGQLFSTIVMF